MHYLVFVFIDPEDADCIEDAVARKLHPFDETIEVERHREDISLKDALTYIIEHEKVDIADPNFNIHDPKVVDALQGYFVPQDEELKWDEERECFYYYTTINPNGQFDWYEIGGRWRSELGTTITHEQAAEQRPYAFVVDGKWISKERWDPASSEFIMNEDYEIEFINALQSHHEDILVVVDAHG